VWQWILRSMLVGCGFALAACSIQAQGSAGEMRLALFGGPAFRTGAASRPFELGISGDVSLFRVVRSRLGVGALAEGGLYHPAISGKGNFYFSADVVLEHSQPMGASEFLLLRPYAVVGYTRFFSATDAAIDTANSMNAGLGVDLELRDELSLRLEVRGRYTPADGSHEIVLRLGLVGNGSIQ
jgi:hypothetical protein